MGSTKEAEIFEESQQTVVAEEKNTRSHKVKVFLETTLDLDLRPEILRAQRIHESSIATLRLGLSEWTAPDINYLTKELLSGIAKVAGDPFWTRQRREGAVQLLETKTIPLDKLSTDQLRQLLRVTTVKAANMHRRPTDPVTSGRFQRAGRVIASYIPS